MRSLGKLLANSVRTLVATSASGTVTRLTTLAADVAVETVAIALVLPRACEVDAQPYPVT